MIVPTATQDVRFLATATHMGRISPPNCGAMFAMRMVQSRRAPDLVLGRSPRKGRAPLDFVRKSAPPESSTMISGRIGVGLRIDGETSVIIRIKEGNSGDGLRSLGARSELRVPAPAAYGLRTRICARTRWSSCEFQMHSLR